MGEAVLALREVAMGPYAADRFDASAEAFDRVPVPDPLAFRPPPVTDPSVVDADTLEDVGDENATLAAHLHSGMQRVAARRRTPGPSARAGSASATSPTTSTSARSKRNETDAKRLQNPARDVCSALEPAPYSIG